MSSIRWTIIIKAFRHTDILFPVNGPYDCELIIKGYTFDELVVGNWTYLNQVWDYRE